MQFTPSKLSLKGEDDIVLQKNPNLLENNIQNKSFHDSPLKLYCEDISEIDKRNENGWTPVYRSIIANNLNILSELLKLGANPNLQNNIGETPLYLCVDIDNYDALNMLLQNENKADCNISKKDGTTPLHLAAKKKKEKFIKILLQNGANPNIPNKLYSQTALHLAVKNKLGKDIILEFKKNGADFFGIKDKYDKTPFDYAKELYDDEYLNMVKNIFENNEEKEKENIIELKEDFNKDNDIKIDNINNNNIDNINNDKISELNTLFKDIELKMTESKNNENNDYIENQSNNNNNNELKEIELVQDNKDINNIIVNENKKEEEINTDIIVDNEDNDKNIELKESINNNEQHNDNDNNDIMNLKIYEEIKSNEVEPEYKKSEEPENYILSDINDLNTPLSKENININNINTNSSLSPKSKSNSNSLKINQKIYQPKKSIKRKSFKSNNQKIKPSKINKNILKKDLIKDDFSSKELLTAKGRENNLGLGITLTSSDNDIFKSKTVKNSECILNDINHPKLSTLSENDLLKNIILDTAKKIKNHNIINHTTNINNTNSQNSLTSPINTLKSEKKIEINNVNDSKKEMNSMNPLDMMNQIITTNSNMSNDTQELMNINTNNNINNNGLKADSDLLEYSKSYATNPTHMNNTDKNSLTNNNNYINNAYGNSSSGKKNEGYKKISYHCSKFLHKNNKGINLNNNFNEAEYNHENEENVNEDESDEISENNENINPENINSIKYKNLSVNNHINNNNAYSSYANSKYNSVLDNNGNNNNINQKYKNQSLSYNSQTNSNSNSNTKYNSIQREIDSKTSTYNPNSYKEKISRNRPLKLNNAHNENSKSNTSYNSNTNNSSSKKYEKKLAILSELEKSKNNNSNNNNINPNNNINNNYQYNLNSVFNLKSNVVQPMKTSLSDMEGLSNRDENDSIMKIASPQNIPNDLSSKLHDWLISCDLLCYYNLLIKNKIYDINQFINNIKSNKTAISYKTVEDFGIKKPGHIYRFLLKIKIDSNMLDPYIYNCILDKYNRSSVNDIKISMSSTGLRVGCCCFRNGGGFRGEKRSINSGIGNEYLENSNDIFSFLKKMDLLRLKENFIHNGFDQVEFIMIQIFSEYKFSKEILNECLHIYDDEDKKKVLKKLYNEKKKICQEYNIKYNEEEDKEIMEEFITDNDNNDNEGNCSIF